jgi:hypothetical protein
MGRSTLATCRSHKRALGCDSVMRISGNFTAKKVRCHDALVEASPAKRIHLLYGSANVTCPKSLHCTTDNLVGIPVTVRNPEERTVNPGGFYPPEVSGLPCVKCRCAWARRGEGRTSGGGRYEREIQVNQPLATFSNRLGIRPLGGLLLPSLRWFGFCSQWNVGPKFSNTGDPTGRSPGMVLSLHVHFNGAALCRSRGTWSGGSESWFGRPAICGPLWIGTSTVSARDRRCRRAPSRPTALVFRGLAAQFTAKNAIPNPGWTRSVARYCATVKGLAVCHRET